MRTLAITSKDLWRCNDMIEILKVILLGIIEGITEWLPISSTGHMLLFDAFVPLNMLPDFKEMFFVVIQFGAILSVIVLQWSQMWPFIHKTDKQNFSINMDIIKMWLKVMVALIPSIILGLSFDDYIESHFYTPVVIATMLIFYGIWFILIEKKNKNRTLKVDIASKIPYKTAIIIGLFQVLAMVPGTSRSGATIIGALMMGVSRTAAAEFTFFLAVPTMLGASLLKIVKFQRGFSGIEIYILVGGMIVAFIVSIIAIKFLLNYIKKHDFAAFGWYRIILGTAVLALFML
jgi:undecaprenyl-diphosphatase